MKQRPGSTKELSLARKRALIRSLVEQMAGNAGAPIACGVISARDQSTTP